MNLLISFINNQKLKGCRTLFKGIHIRDTKFITDHGVQEEACTLDIQGVVAEVALKLQTWLFLISMIETSIFNILDKNQQVMTCTETNTCNIFSHMIKCIWSRNMEVGMGTYLLSIHSLSSQYAPK